MSDEHSHQINQERLRELVLLADRRPLTEAETEELNVLLAADEGTVVTEHFLRTTYQPTGSNRSWSSADLSQIAANIDKEVAKQSRQRRFGLRFQQMAWVTAAFVCLFGVAYFWLINSQPEFEPAIQFEVEPTQTPLPTPTLQANYQYAELLTAPVTQTTQLEVNDYSLTVPEALAQWDGELYLPSQMARSWTFLGAVVHQDKANNPIIEMAFVQKTLGREDLWILSQTLADGQPFNRPLSVVYQPLDDVNETNIYEDKLLTIEDSPAYGYQYELVDRNKNPIEWVVYNTATWQQDEQLLTLTFVARNNFPTNIVALTAEKLDLKQVNK